MTAAFRSNENHFEEMADIPSRMVFSRGSSETPFLSVVIPTYRRSDLLEMALTSALNQSQVSCAYEVIVVDNDADADDQSPTAQLVQQSSGTAPLTYYRNTKNLGIAGNWNRCVELARGEWVGILHDDDMLRPDYVERIYSLLMQHPQAQGIMVDFYPLYDGADPRTMVTRGWKSSLYDRLGRGKLMPLRQQDSDIMLSNVYGAPTCGSVFRKGALLEVGGFDPALHPSFDWFLLYRFCGKYPLYRTMERLGYYRFFTNVSMKDETKAAFLRQRVDFAEYVETTEGAGAWLRRVFLNEQNNEILNTQYTDHVDKLPSDYFPEETLRHRPFRAMLYRLITKAYWKGKSIGSLLFG